MTSAPGHHGGAREADGTLARATGSARNSAAAIADFLRAQILAGDLRAGQRLVTQDIATLVGTSVSPVREAILVLERDGWVTSRPYRVAHVRPLDARAVTEQFCLISTALGLAVRRAIELSSDAELALVADAGRNVARATTVQDLARLNREFIERVLAAGDSPHLAAFVRRRNELFPRDLFHEIPASAETLRIGAAAVASAFERRDPSNADRLCREMVRHECHAIVELLARRGVLKTSPALDLLEAHDKP